VSRVSGVSTNVSRGCYEQTTPEKFRLIARATTVNLTGGGSSNESKQKRLSIVQSVPGPVQDWCRRSRGRASRGAARSPRRGVHSAGDAERRSLGLQRATGRYRHLVNAKRINTATHTHTHTGSKPTNNRLIAFTD